MADNGKQQDFVTRLRQCTAQYQAVVEQARALDKEWIALYNNLIVEGDFQGENLNVIPSGDPPARITSVTSVISNFESIITSYDAGINTNMERVS